jgi:hypothetical protein
VNTATGVRLSVSTWSLHRTLGRPSIYGPAAGDAVPAREPAPGALPLLELPAQLAAFGIHTLEICHFHLPSRDAAYLAELRSALAGAGVELFSLLIDAGDITDPQHGGRDLAWIAGWIDVAAALGATCARVVAGQAQHDAGAVDRACQGLRQLADYASARSVRLMTENFQELMAGPATVHYVLDRLAGDLGLCADFGNWRGPGKYADLAAIFPRAESCHAKCEFDAAGQPDRADYIRCLELAQAAGFRGPYTLIYSGPSADEWAGLAVERAMVAPYLPA